MNEESLYWVMDEFIRQTGFQARNPDSMGLELEWGIKWGHYQAVSRRIRSFAMVDEAWANMAERVRKLAEKAEKEDHRLTALEYYFLASIYYCRAQWPIWVDNDPRLLEYHKLKNECFDKVIELNTYPIERMEIPFDGKQLPAILHLPSREGTFPVVVIIPGMDVTKEEVVGIMNNRYIKRGIAVLAIDGPGQGESLAVRNIKIDQDNFERAGVAAYDAISKHKNIKKDKIALFGISFGSYIATRIASVEPRYVACGAALACVEPGMNTIFNHSYPSFRLRFKYMSGITDDDQFDEFRKKLSLVGRAEKIQCPYLFVTGEYDQLCPLRYVKQLYDSLKCPKQFIIYKGEFHTLGKVANEAFDQIADWFMDRFNGRTMNEGWFEEPAI